MARGQHLETDVCLEMEQEQEQEAWIQKQAPSPQRRGADVLRAPASTASGVEFCAFEGMVPSLG